MSSNTSTNQPKLWLSPEELREWIGISESKQAKLRMNKAIPFSKVGRQVRYNRDKINQWLEEASVV